jgi:phosphatidylinositol alpha 1,6-mannosyltransferase
MKPLRVALFADSFHEVNGAAHTFRHYQAYAERRGLPLLAVHSGSETRCFRRGPVTTLELKRSPATFAVDVDFGFDPLLWRYWRRIHETLAGFKPDVVHIISPGDFSVLGACAAHKLRVPVVGSFHTNLHQFASARLQKTLRFLPASPRQAICRLVERVCGRGLLKYYEIPRLILAPNPEIKQWLEQATGRACRIMRRGVDIDLFHPSRRDCEDGIFRLGFVGRLTREKNLGLLVGLEQRLIATGRTRYRLVIVGQGGERSWLEKVLLRADFTGVLHGEELARAYANMDLLVFPSRTDAFGNVVQEALAAGTPALVTDQGGPKYLVESGVTGYVTADDCDFVDKAIALMSDGETHRCMRVAARQAACAASWERVFEEVWDSYQICLQLPGRRTALVREEPLRSENVA